MSDSDCSSTSDSICSDSSACSENSICEALELLIEQLHEIHTHHHNAIETLENLHALVAESKNILVDIEGKKRDFDEVLEELHLQALDQIRKGEKAAFGSNLIAIISAIENK